MGWEGVGDFYFGIRRGELFPKTFFVEVYAGIAVIYFPLENLLSSDGASL